MRFIIAGLVAAGLVTGAAAQVNSQTSASGSSQTSVNASKTGASANTNNSANANQNVKAGKKADASASGSASQNANAGTGDLQIPFGTKVPAVLDKSVDSRKCKQGDEVVAKTTSDVVSNGKVIIPKNSRLIGHVTEASAKANGGTDSTLGIVFDKAMLRNGSTVPMQARIQALTGPAVSAAGSMADDSMVSAPVGGGTMSSSSSGRASGGAPLGGAVSGVTNTVGSTAGAVGNTAGGGTQGVGSTVNSTAGATGAVSRTAGGTVSATNALNSTSSGVIGLKGLQLNSDTANAANGSVITSAGKNVRLDSGSRMVLDVVGSVQSN